MEEGGYGAGTRIRVGVHLAGRKSSFRADVSEPEPGRVLARDRDGGVLIEIRGEGHQVVAPGSPSKCHPLNVPYRFERAGWLAGVCA